jgi:hypothetical protein
MASFGVPPSDAGTMKTGGPIQDGRLLALQDRGEGPDDVVPFEHEPSRVVRARDLLDRLDRVVRRDDARAVR